MTLEDYNMEIRRKLFHCMSIVFPIFYLLTDKITMIIVLLIIAGLALSIDISRHYNPTIQDVVGKFFTNIMREDEVSGNFKLSGVSYMLLGFFITCVLFNKGIAISAFLVLIVSDTVAALVGKKIGTPQENGKSFEGSGAFAVTAMLIGMLSYTFHAFNTSFSSIIIASLVTSAVEYYSAEIKINDNFAIPVTYGLVLTILSWL